MYRVLMFFVFILVVSVSWNILKLLYFTKFRNIWKIFRYMFERNSDKYFNANYETIKQENSNYIL